MMKVSPKRLLVSDMDGTVIPLDRLKKRGEEIKEFSALVKKDRHLKVVYATGRHLALALAGARQYKLPLPDMFICDVGTSIYTKVNGNWKLDKGYRKILKKSWHSHDRKDIAKILKDIPGVITQERQKLKEFKQSYYAPLKLKKDKILKDIAEALKKERVKSKIIYSVDTKKNRGLVDVLPEKASKDFALKYLMDRLKVQKKSIVYAGDSGNDMDAFLSGFNIIVVNNTRPAIKKEVKSGLRRKGMSKRAYFTRQKYTKGVVEGCYHFGLFKG